MVTYLNICAKMKYLIHISYILLGCITFTYSNVINHNSDDNVVLNKSNNNNDNNDVVMTLEDQVQLLSKQLNALMTRRREDYKMLENSLKKYVRKNSLQFLDKDIKNELDQLR